MGYSGKDTLKTIKKTTVETRIDEELDLRNELYYPFIDRRISDRRVSDRSKGNAIRTGFGSISNDTDYVIMLDGDNTYKAKEIPRFIEPLENDFCDVIVGSRLEGKLNGDSLSFSHRLANWFFTFLTRRLYLVNTTDICTGYFAWKKEVIDELIPHIKSEGFGIEAEMITKMAKLGFKIFSVPITYDKREGNSKLSPYLDGLKILWILLKNINWRPEGKVKEAFSADTP